MTNAFLFADNASTTLASPAGPSATSLTVAAGTGGLFPAPGTGQMFAVSLNDAATREIYEVCYCTGRAGDVLTVARAQEGTAASSWSIGDIAFNGPTSGQMAQMVQQPHMVDASISPIFGATRVEGAAIVDGTINCIDPNARGGLAVVGTAQGAAIELGGNGSATPIKWLRAINGLFDIVNSAYTAEIFTLNDAGDLTNIRSVTVPNQSAGGYLYGRDTFGTARQMLSYGGDNVIDLWGGLAGLRILRGSDGAQLVFLDTGGNLTALGTLTAAQVNSASNMNAVGAYTGGQVNVTGPVQGQSIAAANGNVTANNGYLRASLGFFNNPGDNSLAPLLNDFIVNAGTPGSLQIPARGTQQGFIFQFGRSATSGLTTNIFFPKVFPAACVGVVTCEGIGSGWNGGSNATLHSPFTVPATNGFVNTCVRWNGSSFVAGLNETVNWLAWGV